MSIYLQYYDNVNNLAERNIQLIANCVTSSGTDSGNRLYNRYIESIVSEIVYNNPFMFNREMVNPEKEIEKIRNKYKNLHSNAKTEYKEGKKYSKRGYAREDYTKNETQKEIDKYKKGTEYKMFYKLASNIEKLEKDSIPLVYEATKKPNGNFMQGYFKHTTLKDTCDLKKEFKKDFFRLAKEREEEVAREVGVKETVDFLKEVDPKYMVDRLCSKVDNYSKVYNLDNLQDTYKYISEITGDNEKAQQYAKRIIIERTSKNHYLDPSVIDRDVDRLGLDVDKDEFKKQITFKRMEYLFLTIKNIENVYENVGAKEESKKVKIKKGEEAVIKQNLLAYIKKEKHIFENTSYFGKIENNNELEEFENIIKKYGHNTIKTIDKVVEQDEKNAKRPDEVRKANNEDIKERNSTIEKYSLVTVVNELESIVESFDEDEKIAAISMLEQVDRSDEKIYSVSTDVRKSLNDALGIENEKQEEVNETLIK